MRRTGKAALAVLAMLALAGCGGGGGGGSADTGDDGTTFKGLIDFPALESLSEADVLQVLADATAEATARGAPADIAVVDRVGNVLAVFRMTGVAGTPAADLRAEGFKNANGSGLDGLTVPGGAPVGAIAKAVTGAYLSSAGNAFSTRTASQIVQENFNPGELRQPGGPLFGVQFSQLPCSDLSTRFLPGGGPNALIGPKRSPLGLAADPGGLPLYKNGVVVGGVGVLSDGAYALDPEPLDRDIDDDELIALAATRRFLPPREIEAPRITVEGKALRYTDGGLDSDLPQLRSAPAAAPGSVAALPGSLIDVGGYYAAAGGLLAGSAYGDVASGYVPLNTLPAGGGPRINVESAYVLVDGTGANRFPLRDATAGDLTAVEAARVIEEGLGIALAGRGQIRRPIESPIHVTVTVVDLNGVVLGLARTPDGPIFGTDVALQKARSALFFSDARAAGDLAAVPGVTANVGAQVITLPPLADYVTAMDGFVGPGALRGDVAFSNRGIGNLARPFYPDGINDNGPGPLSRAFNGPDPTTNWSPFSTGLQFDLIGGDILEHVFFILGASPTDTDAECTAIPPRAVGAPSPLGNGLQIFAGSVPIYRGDRLVGAVGVSGDGIDQDDMIAALGLKRAGDALGTGIGNAPAGIRSDTLSPGGVPLRYVSCPFGPFRDSDAQNVCTPL